jgi:hypothetical protein
MSRSANTLSALNSAPGVFGSVNTIIVLSAFSGSDDVLLIRMKRVMFSLKSWMPDSERSQAEHLAARADAIAAASAISCRESSSRCPPCRTSRRFSTPFRLDRKPSHCASPADASTPS